MSAGFAELVGQVVVVDIDGPVIYIGRLAAVGEDSLQLEEVDVHNLGDSATGRDKYLIEACKLGVRPNRRKAEVRLARVVGVSRLEDIIDF
jgi:hypothetical protein